MEFFIIYMYIYDIQISNPNLGFIKYFFNQLIYSYYLLFLISLKYRDVDRPQYKI